jgi:dTDP-glucose pyrophosphorylase/CBS domain-containing protein
LTLGMLPMRTNSSPPGWERALLSVDATLQEAIQNLDETTLKIVLVTSRQGQLIGTVSDGDIRRGLLKGLDLQSSLTSVVHPSPLVVPSGLPQEAVVQLMRANKILQIPIVDAEHRVVGLHLWNYLNEPQIYSNLMVIMAGGRGERLLPLTEHCPKPMIPIAGKPMLEHIIERAVRDGFRHFVLAINYLGHVIEEYFGDGSSRGIEITYLREESSLGTAGALYLLPPLKAPVLVSNGDVMTDVSYAEVLDFHVRHDAAATMAVRPYEWQHPFGVVQTQGIEIVGVEEKPVHRSQVNAGIYVLEPAVVDLIDSNESYEMPDLFEKVMLQGMRVIAYPMHEPWLDVGRPQDLEKARMRI